MNINDVKDRHLIEAIRTSCENCWGALQMCNALGGDRDEKWAALHTFTRKQLVEEANRRGINLTDVKLEIDPKGTPVTESMYYKRSMGVMTEAEFQKAFREWKK